jgi:hypothetical protein
MADKRISQLVERTDIANNDVVPIVASGATTTNKATISSIQEFMQENLDLGVTSVGITLGTTGTDVSVTGSPITTSGNITLNIPDASTTARGLVNTIPQTFNGSKTFSLNLNVAGLTVGRGASNGNQFNGIAGNTALGQQALFSITTGFPNTAVGVEALRNITTGVNNIGIGSEAGKVDVISGAANATSNSSIYIGNNSKPNANGGSNEVVIGHNAAGSGSNTVTIGNSSTTLNRFFGRVMHGDAVAADQSATLGQVNTSLAGYVTLGTAQTITAQKTFSTSGSSDTAIINHGSGSGIALNITKAGNGEGLRVAKTSGSGNAVTITGGLLSAGAATFGGNILSNEFLYVREQIATTLLANYTQIYANSTHFGFNNGAGTASAVFTYNGSWNYTLPSASGTLALTSNLSAYLPLAGGTLTGALNGTSASFTGNLTTSGELLVSGSTGYIQVGTGSLSKVSIESTGTIGIIGTRDASDLVLRTNLTPRLTLASTGAATFSSTIRSNNTNGLGIGDISGYRRIQYDPANTRFGFLTDANGLANIEAGAATFSSSVQTGGNVLIPAGSRLAFVGDTDRFMTPEDNIQGARIKTPGGFVVESTGATFSSSVTAGGNVNINGSGARILIQDTNQGTAGFIAGRAASEVFLGNDGGLPLSFLVNSTERMRITSGGYLKASNNGTYYGSTGGYHEIRSNAEDWTNIVSNTNASPYGIFIQYTSASPNGISNEFLTCRDSGLTIRAVIRSNGGLSNYQANDTNLSDERTKKDIEPLESYWDKFKAIEIVKFKYKDQTHDDFNIGVIAQQVESVAPEFVDVDGWVDKPELDEEGNEIVTEEEPLKSIYTADLHHATIKVLQEAMAKIEKLEEEISSLKNQIK